MKLNKREQLAFHTLREILDTFEKGEVLEVTNKEQNAVQEVFNINLYEITYRKSQVKEFKRGKDKAHIVLLNRINREPFPYGFFPFQIKQDKVKERAKEIEELKKQEREKRKEIEYYPRVEFLKRAIEEVDDPLYLEPDLRRVKEFLVKREDLTTKEKYDLLELIIKTEKLF